MQFPQAPRSAAEDVQGPRRQRHREPRRASEVADPERRRAAETQPEDAVAPGPDVVHVQRHVRAAVARVPVLQSSLRSQPTRWPVSGVWAIFTPLIRRHLLTLYTVGLDTLGRVKKCIQISMVKLG